MNILTSWKLPTLLLSSSIVLIACGGGSGGGSTIPPPSQTPGPVITPSPSPNPCVNGVVRQTNERHRGTTKNSLQNVVPNQVYVVYRSGQRNIESLSNTIRAEKSVMLGENNNTSQATLFLSKETSAQSAIDILRTQSNVLSASLVHYRYLNSCTSSVNDQYADNTDQWYLFKTNVTSSLPTANAWSLSHGSGVSIAMIDTGVDETNTDLAPKMDVRESIVNGVINTGVGSVQDTNGHGTNTAGLAVAQPNNTYGFAGVGWDTRLQVYKIFPDATTTSDNQSASTTDEVIAINHAVKNGASVISLSLGSPQAGGFDQAEKDAIISAIAQGVVVVAAAGNEFPATGSDVLDYPAAYPGVVSVGASAVQNTIPNTYASITNETVASYSNSGPTLVAPGGDANTTSDSDILHWIEGYSTTTAAYPPDKCSNSGGVCRVLFNGTSQATPQVSGVIALMEAYHGGPKSLTPAQVINILSQNSDAISSVPQTRQGAGRLNGYRAVNASQ